MYNKDIHSMVGNVCQSRWPFLRIEEDILSEHHYWINITAVGKTWIVIEVFSGGFGVSFIAESGLHLDGHDVVCKNLEEALNEVSLLVSRLED